MRIKICFPYAKSPAARYSPCRGAFVFRYETAALLQKLQKPGDTRYDAAAHRAGSFEVEAEQPLLLAVFLCQQLTYLIKEPKKGGRSGTVRRCNRPLVHHHDTAFVLSGKYLGYQRALSRTGHAGYNGHDTEWYIYIHTFQVMKACTTDRQSSGRPARALPDWKRLSNSRLSYSLMPLHSTDCHGSRYMPSPR